MSSIAEIEAAVSRLNRDDFAKFAAWFKEERNRIWDSQIESDSKSGKLDFLLKELDDEIARSGVRPTDELCDDR